MLHLIDRSGVFNISNGLWPRLSDEAGRRRLDVVLVLALSLLAFSLRVHELDLRSLWPDEGFTTLRISLSMGEIIAGRMPFDNVVTQDSHPALYFILLKLLRELAGANAFTLKYVSVAWSVLLVPLFFVSGRLLLSTRAGRAAALFAALSPVYLWYGQELRMYTQIVALSLLSVYTLARASQLGHWRRWLLAGVVTAAMCYTHYTGLFVAFFEVLALAVIVHVVGRARRFIALAVALLSTTPLLVLVFPRILQGPEPNFNFVPLDLIAHDLLNSFSLGISVRVESVWWLDLIFLLILLVGALAPFKDGRYSAWPAARALLIGYLVVPVLGYYIFTYVKPAFQGVRHLLLVSPAFYLLLARGVTVIGERWKVAALGLLVLFCGGMAYSAGQYFWNPHYLKDDWRGMVRYIETHAWARDAVLVNNTFVRPTLDYYDQGDGLFWLSAPELSLNLMEITDTQTMSRTLSELKAQHPRIWFIPGRPQDGRDEHDFVLKWLEQNMTFNEEIDFHGRTLGMSVRLYTTQSLVADARPAGSTDPQLSWPIGLELRGVKLRLGAEVTGGQLIPVQLSWRVPAAPAPQQLLSTDLELVDANGTVWVSTAAPIVPPGFKRGWPIGRYVVPGYTVPLPPGLPPGTYTLRVALRAEHGDGAGTIVPLAGGEPSAVIATLTVSTATSIPDVRRIDGYVPASVRFDNGVELLGYRVISVIVPGQPVVVQFFWRGLRDRPDDARVTLELTDWLGRSFAQGGAQLSSDVYPLSTWRSGQVVATSAAVLLPAQIADGTYRIRMGLQRASGPVAAYTELWPFGRAAVDLGPLAVAAWPKLTDLPDGATPVEARFGDNVTLAGYHVDGVIAPGNTVNVTLYWLADQPPGAAAADLVTYVHALSAPDPPNAEPVVLVLHDSTPANGLRPVDTWRAGEIIADAHVFLIPANARPGAYVVYVGAYSRATGGRWPITLGGVAQPNDELPLLEWTIAP
jgi:4-amino-4-deoxy-L-arabinose transferase-like glycosyltransferase